MKKYITIIAAVALAACQPAPEPSYKVKEYATFEEPTRSRMAVSIIWLDDPTDYCALREGTLTSSKEKYLGCSAVLSKGTVCEITLARPKDFNDDVSLEVLGHELMHCMGAKHE